jgi:hypothetical protein
MEFGLEAQDDRGSFQVDGILYEHPYDEDGEGAGSLVVRPMFSIHEDVYWPGYEDSDDIPVASSRYQPNSSTLEYLRWMNPKIYGDLEWNPDLTF